MYNGPDHAAGSPSMAKGAGSGAGAELRLCLLGSFRVAVGSRVTEAAAWRLRAARSLLKLLALAPGHRLHREELLDQLWPEPDPDAATARLHYTLHVARRALAPARATAARYLRLERDLVILCPDAPLWIDVEAFEAAVGVARGTRSLGAYRAALALYTGDLLPEDRYEDWATGRREALRAQYLALLVELAGLYDAGGECEAARAALQQVVAAEPAHEEAHVGLMRLHALAGERHQALRQYQQLRDALRREVDAEPASASQQLYEEILAGRGPVRAPLADVRAARTPGPT